MWLIHTIHTLYMSIDRTCSMCSPKCSNAIIKFESKQGPMSTDSKPSTSNHWAIRGINNYLNRVPVTTPSHNQPNRLSSDTFNPDASRNSKHRKHSRWSIIEQSSNQQKPSSRKDIRTIIPFSLPRLISWCADMAEGWEPDRVTFQPPPHESAAVVSLIARLSIPRLAEHSNPSFFLR